MKRIWTKFDSRELIVWLVLTVHVGLFNIIYVEGGKEKRRIECNGIE